MKNSPDQDWFVRLSRRLGEYHEDPDDGVLKMILAATGHRAEPSWLRWAHRAEAVTSLVLLMFALMIFVDARGPVDHQAVGEKQSASQENFATLEAEGGTGNSGSEMEGSAATIHNAASMRKFKQTRRNIFQYPTIVSRHKAASVFLLSEIQVNLSPIRGLATFPDSSEHEKPNEITANEDRKEAPLIPARKKRPIAFYGSLSPSFGFQKISPFSNDGVSIKSFHKKSVFSQDRFGITVEGGVQWRVGRRWEFYSGLSLFRQSQTLAYNYVSGENENIVQEDDFVYAVDPGNTRKRVDYSMLNVGAEFGILYLLKGDRLMHKTGAGVSWQHGFREIHEGESYNNAKSQYFFYQVFYRNEYLVSNQLKFFVQPFYKHVLVSKEVLDEPFEVRPYYAGLRFGVVYRMR